jgi:Phage portal protein, SPP1 Gp6-like
MPIVDVSSSLDALEEKIAGADWPLEDEKDIHNALDLFSALYDTDAPRLKTFAGVPASHQYVPDPLPTKIADASSNMIFGEEPEIEAGESVERGDEGEVTTEGDQPELDELVEENALPSELQRAASICAAEGEVWWRILVDPAASDRPIIDWHSRSTVVPSWRGRHLLACAFISELEDSTANKTWRYVEMHAQGIVRRRLFLGRSDKVGALRELTAHGDTADLQEEWRHNLGVRLAGRIPNRLGRDPRLGVSDYTGVLEYLFALNEAASIGRHNARLTLRKRAVMPAGIARPDGATPEEETAGGARVELDDVWLLHPDDDEMGDGAGPMKVLEYSDTWAEALIAYTGDLVEKVLTRVGIAPQLIGMNTENAVTGPALRARLLDSVQTANGKARYWDDELPKMLSAAALVDSLSEAQGGLGHNWQSPAAPPVIRRKSILPEDPTDKATRVVALSGAGLLSKETGIREMFPEWDDERVQEELDNLSAQSEQLQAPLSNGRTMIRTERPPVRVDGNPSDAGFRPFGRPEEGTR